MVPSTSQKYGTFCHSRNNDLVPNKCQGGAIYILVPTKCQDGAIREIIICYQISAIWEVVFWCQAGSIWHRLVRERRCQSPLPGHQIQVAFWCQASSIWHRLVGKEGVKAPLLGTKYKWYFGAKQVPYGTMFLGCGRHQNFSLGHRLVYIIVFAKQICLQ